MAMIKFHKQILHFMNPLIIILSLCFCFKHVNGQTQDPDPQTPFRPSLVIALAVLSIMLFFVFLFLTYVKFFGATPSDIFRSNGVARSRFSGIDKAVVDSLPLIRFSALKGSKEGLECAVCLSRFDDPDVLRLLPGCLHAFHVSCVDKWLESHSSCPLCRYKVEPGATDLFVFATSTRSNHAPSEVPEDGTDVELFVQRELEHEASSRFTIGASFRKTDNLSVDELWLRHEDIVPVHWGNRRSLVSDVLLKNRWSDVSSSDLILLDPDIDFCGTPTEKQFGKEPISNYQQFEMQMLEEMGLAPLAGADRKISSSGVSRYSTRESISDVRRSVSEIISLSRYANVFDKIDCDYHTYHDVKEDRRRAFLRLARRTIKWFSRRGAGEAPPYSAHGLDL